MSAQIINLTEWRRAHQDRTPPSRPVRLSIPIIVPTWGWGWFTPVLCSMTVEW
jgi:hypothetical protein